MLTRVKEFAELAIPSMYPRNGTSEMSELPVPFAAATGRGVTRLASRITSALVPLNGMPFFALELDDAEPVEGTDPTEEQKVLHRMERRMMRKLAGTNFRATLYTAMQHCEVLGNVLMIANDNYSYSLIRVDNYVVTRRADGEWHEIIYREWVDPAAPPEILEGKMGAVAPGINYQYGQDKDLAMYTRVKNDHKGGCSIEREFRGQKIDEGVHPVCPYFPMRWTLVAGENYGRGLIEDNCGDVRALEVMAEALLDSIAANAEYRFGVNPAGLTELHDLQESTNGSFVPAAQADVFPIQLGNQAQVAMAQNCVTLKEQTLGHVFLMNSAIQPQGERVTATQVRILASEIEQALGGSGLGDQSRDVITPATRYLMYRMLTDGLLVSEDDELTDSLLDELTKPDGILGIKVKTGLEVLNREIENERMRGIMETCVRLPEAAQQAMVWPGILNRWIASEGVEPSGLVLSVQEVQAQQQIAQQQAMQQAAAQQAIQSGGAIAEQAAAQGSEQ